MAPAIHSCLGWYVNWRPKRGSLTLQAKDCTVAARKWVESSTHLPSSTHAEHAEKE